MVELRPTVGLPGRVYAPMDLNFPSGSDPLNIRSASPCYPGACGSFRLEAPSPGGPVWDSPPQA